MKKEIILISVIFVFLIIISCAKVTPVAPVNATPTLSRATLTAVALLTAGPAAQATATAQAQLTAKAGATLTAIATLRTATMTPTISPTYGPIIISAYLTGSDQSGGFTSSGAVTVHDSHYMDITDAAVTIKNITTSSQFTCVYSGYEYEPASFSYQPGCDYEVDVCVKSVTYTAITFAPGPAQLDDQGNILTWQHGGNNNRLYVSNPDHTQAFYITDSNAGNGSKNVDLSGVYPASGQYGWYGVDVTLENRLNGMPGIFNGASTNSYFELDYNCSWDVEVSALTQAVGTPTPTCTPILVINAYIQAVDNGGAIQCSQYAYVTGNNYSQITNATVTVKNLSGLTEQAAVYSQYNGRYIVQAPVYAPGDSYEFDVIFNGVTYTAPFTAPGPAQISADCNSVSMQHCSERNIVTVVNPDNSQAFYQSSYGNLGGVSQADLTNVYGASGQFGVYRVYVTLENENKTVFTEPAVSGWLNILYSTGWAVSVSPGGRELGTPTPTQNAPGAHDIEANIYVTDNHGSMTSREYVYVRDAAGSPIADALVRIYNVTSGGFLTLAYGGYSYYINDPAYIFGDTYEVNVEAGGGTYTARFNSPGPAQIDPAGNTVSWYGGGTSNNVSVHDPSWKYVFSETSGGAASVTRTVDISQAYTAGVYGMYGVSAGLTSVNNNVFTGTTGASYVRAEYSTSWQVSVSAASRYAITPTPTP